MHELSTIKVTGADTLDFLQGQLSSDLRDLEPGARQRSAWCNPKGRVIWFGTVTADDGGFSLDVPADRAEELVKRLTMFRFRSKVDFEIVADSATLNPAELIEDGIPWIGAAQAEEFTPHMLNLDLLDAISLDKGCYTGQEIVARTHYKGATKRRTMRFSCNAPVSVGDKIQLDGRDVGEVLNAAGGELLAVVPVDKADKKLCAGGASLERLDLPYVV